MTESYANKGLGGKMKKKWGAVVGEGGRQNGGETHSSVTPKLLYVPYGTAAPPA